MYLRVPEVHGWTGEIYTAAVPLLLIDRLEQERMEEVRWGILGCGNVCEVKSGPPLYKIEGSKLVAVMRRDLSLAKDFAHRHGVPKAYDNAEDVLKDPEVNAVYIATPPGTHLELAKLVAKYGKACYVEKPMARNLKETEELCNAFKEAKLPLYAAYYRRGQERFRYAREIVLSGKIGTVTSVIYKYCNNTHENGALAAASVGGPHPPWRWNPEISGGGLIMDVGCHTLDIIDFIVGPFSVNGAVSSNVASPG